MELKNKTVLVTGAARGLGAAIARGVAAQGAELALVDLKESSLADTQRACQELGVTARTYGADVANETEVIALFNQTVQDFGRLDGLVNNAGILRDGLLVKVKDG